VNSEERLVAELDEANRARRNEQQCCRARVPADREQERDDELQRPEQITRRSPFKM
jgi:hypothetical protein